MKLRIQEESFIDRHDLTDFRDIMHLATNSGVYWEQGKRQMTKGKRWYDQDVPILTPKNIENHVPSTAPTLVNDAADHLAGNDPDFVVKERRESGRAIEEQTRVQMSLNAIYDQLGREWGHALHRTLAIHGGWSGMMCCRVGVHEDWNMDEPSVEDIYWQPVDPRYVFPDPGTLGRKYVIYRFQRKVGLIRQAWPDWEGYLLPRGSSNDMFGGYNAFGVQPESRERMDTPLNDNDVVDWVEYWDNKYKCYIANGVPVFRADYGQDWIEHGLGMNPFVIRASGYGDDTGESHERFRSMLSYVFHWLDLEARLITQYKWIVEDTAWPTWLAPEDMRGLDVHPGTINYVPNPESIKAFRAVREDSVKPEAVVQLLTYVKDEIEKATYPVILKGQAPSGIRAGYPIAILTTQARLKFAAPLDALKSIFQELAYKTMAIVKNRFEQPMKVMDGYKLKPEDFDNYMGRVSVNLEAHLPSDLASKLPMLEFMVGSLGYPRALAMKELGVENPEELRELRWAEDMEEDPRIKQAGADQLLKLMLPEDQAAAYSVLGPQIEIQKMQESIQQLQGQIQLMQMQSQYKEMQGQLQQMQQTGVTNTGAPQGAPPQQGGVPAVVPPVPPQGSASQAAMGQGPGGSPAFGQNPGAGGAGANRQQLNPDTQLSGIARNERAMRTMEEMRAQSQAYGEATI